MKPFQVTSRMRKTAAGLPSGAVGPEERVGGGSNGSPSQSPQPPDRDDAKPDLQKKRDSMADEMPGENPDDEGKKFNGQGDYSSRGEKQPILDYTPCTWGAQQVMQMLESGELEEAPQHGAVAQTAEGEMLVSLEICRQCEFEQGCYGLSDEHEENRLAKKQASGISPEMPEILVAEKVARLSLDEDEARTLLIQRGFSPTATMGIMRLMTGL